MDSAGGNCGKMFWKVAKSSDVISPVEEECEGVYAMESSDGKCLAMLKPTEERSMLCKRGLRSKRRSKSRRSCLCS
jgi:hypothetical protein